MFTTRRPTKFHPYKITYVHELKNLDCEAWTRFSKPVLRNLPLHRVKMAASLCECEESYSLQRRETCLPTARHALSRPAGLIKRGRFLETLSGARMKTPWPFPSRLRSRLLSPYRSLCVSISFDPLYVITNELQITKINYLVCSPKASYTDRATADYRRS